MRPWRNGASGRNAALTLALTIAVSACAVRASPPGLSGLDALFGVVLNGRLIQVTGGSVFELLNHPYAGHILLGHSSTPGGEPLVLLDRVQLDGLYRLADVPAFHAASISVVRPIEARSQFGPRAAYGAIVVLTKRGWLP